MVVMTVLAQHAVDDGGSDGDDDNGDLDTDDDYGVDVLMMMTMVLNMPELTIPTWSQPW